MNAQTEIVGPCSILGRTIIGGYLATVSVISLSQGWWGIKYKPCRDRYGHHVGEVHPYWTLQDVQRVLQEDGWLS